MRSARRLRRQGSRAASFDHLVGAREQRWGEDEADGSGGPQVHGQLEARGLLHRQVSGPAAGQDLGDVAGSAPCEVVRIGAERQKPTLLYVEFLLEDGAEPTLQRERNDPFAVL